MENFRNKNRGRGLRFEETVMKKLGGIKSGKVIKASGSKGKFDLIQFQSNKVRLVICRTNGYLNPKERRYYLDFLRENAGFYKLEIWFKKSQRKIGRIVLSSSAKHWSWNEVKEGAGITVHG